MQRRINRNAPAKGEASAGVDTLLDIRESSHEPLSHGRPVFGSSIAQRANSFFFFFPCFSCSLLFQPSI